MGLAYHHNGELEMLDADMIALRDKAAHKMHIAKAALNVAIEALTALDIEVVSRFGGADSGFHPLDGGTNKPGG